MKHKVPLREGLMSWLKLFDIDYLESSLSDQLSELDVNNPVERAQAILLAVNPEFERLSDASRSSMLQILKDALATSDEALAPMFERVSMPFQNEVSDRLQLLQSMWDAVNIKLGP